MHLELKKLVCPRTYKAAVVVCLLMLLAAAAGFRWVKTDIDKENRLRQELDHLTAESIESINNVVTGKTDSEGFETINRKNEIQSQLELYETRIEKRELTTIASFVAIIFSAAIIVWISLLAITHCILSAIKKMRNLNSNEYEEPFEESSQEHLLEIHNDDATEDEDDADSISEQIVLPLGTVLHKNRFASSYQQNRFMNSLYTDEKNEDCAVAILESEKDNEQSLKQYTRRLEMQLAKFEEKSKAAKEIQQQSSEPIDGTLKELTAQVSAIREYASQQQDRVKKLQEGYDWNIIRTFCLKIIRCIDNIEFRINESDSGTERKNLEDVKDELLFALESSGVEHYQPQIGCDYRGQEKRAEAVKTKLDSEDPEMKGKIAEVIRRGYEYVIDEENTRIVRPAQVKLFG
ncbi:MAG: nucleotide exchange factor GrpE [Phycisphaerae bacterium]|nr:nucleotide exchange factor GrpE [Phycisphaerae bacterium]